MDIQQLKNSGIIEKYVLGLASQEEMDFVEKMAKENPEVDKHICKMQNCMSEYAEMNCVRPVQHSKKAGFSNLNYTGEGMDSVSSGKEIVYHLPVSWKWGAGIATFLIFSLGALSLMLYERQRAALDELSLVSTQIKHLNDDQRKIEANNELIKEEFAVMKDVSTRKIHLKGTEQSPKTHAVLYMNPDKRKCYLDVVDLPKCPFGNEYQIWANVNGQHLDMGILKISDTGAVLHNLPYVKDCSGFVITLEKPGGSTRPTVEQMYAHVEL